MDVLVDDRERKRIFKKINKRVGGNAVWMRLDVGDVQIGDVVYERKSWNDFIASFFTKRMWEQAEKLAHCEHPVIIIYGDPFLALMKRRMGRVPPLQLWKSMMGAIISLTTSWGIPVLLVPREEDFYHIIELTYKKAIKEGKASTRPIAYKRKKRTIQEQAEDMLTMIEGVGRETASNMLKYGGSIKSLSKMDESELKRIEGIGKKGSKHICEVLTTDVSE